MSDSKFCPSCKISKTVDSFSMNRNICKPCRCLDEKQRRAAGFRSPRKPPSPEYQAWQNAKKRCYYEKAPNYDEYGGRGIRMSDEWKDSPETFIKDMGPRPPGKTPNGRAIWSLERIDTNGNYEKDNCKWATYKEQSRNRRDTVYINTDKGVEKLIDLSEKIGINRSSLLERVESGKTGDDLLATKEERPVYEYNGEKLHLCEISRMSNIDKSTLRYRLGTCKMSVEEAISTPIRRKLKTE